VNTDQVTANGAAPAVRFGFEEMGKAVILYLIEVFDEAYGIFGTVAFIDLTKAGTGVLQAGKAKAGIVISFLTCFDGAA
jgi:hypothetical protein